MQVEKTITGNLNKLSQQGTSSLSSKVLNKKDLERFNNSDLEHSLLIANKKIESQEKTIIEKDINIVRLQSDLDIQKKKISSMQEVFSKILLFY